MWLSENKLTPKHYNLSFNSISSIGKEFVFPNSRFATHLIRTSIMTTAFNVTVKLENDISENFGITLPTKVKALKEAIRDFYGLTGGGIRKNVSGTDLFAVITDEDEQLIDGCVYEFVRGKSVISDPSLHSQ